LSADQLLEGNSIMDSAKENCLVIWNGTLIDGTGAAAIHSETIVIRGNRIQSMGPLPDEVRLDDTEHVTVIDATGQWIMPGLIDSHCHISFGHPAVTAVPSGKGAISPEFSTLRAARNAQKMLLSGVTSISVPGGTWFIDAGVRDAIEAGILEGPRIYCAGRNIGTYESISDNEPSWVGAPDHSNIVLTNSVTEMVIETRRQIKHGVNFIKLVDSVWGDKQTIAPEEMKAVVAEAHRRNARVVIHSRGAGSTRAAAEAGVDWIMHADLATETDLELVAARGIPIVPTAFFVLHSLDLGRERGRNPSELDRLKQNWEGIVRMLEIGRKLGINMLCGSDTGNSPIMAYGEYHSREAEILVEYGGYTPMEAIVAMTSNNAITMGSENDLGQISPGKLADIIVLRGNPLSDIRVLRGGTHLSTIIKDGRVIMNDGKSSIIGDGEIQKNHVALKGLGL
jgi:imidazolonepropionase-like amidohydrolase